VGEMYASALEVVSGVCDCIALAVSSSLGACNVNGER